MGKPSGKRFGAVLRSVPRVLLWTAAVLAGLLLVAFVALFFIEEPMRRAMQRGMNASLNGYGATIGEVDFHLIGFSVTVHDLVLRQDAQPEPPVASFPRIHASVHWRELLRGHLVSDWELERPDLHINLIQLREERDDEVPVEERGWQQAVREIYPLEINRLEIRDGAFTYIDDDPDHPLHLSNVNLTSTNIRNIQSPDRTYPSPFQLNASIFDQGYGTVEGEADFLAEPHPGINARFQLQEVPLERLRPISTKANLFISGGMLGGEGRIEYAPEVKTAHLSDLRIEGLRVDFVHSEQTAAREKEQVRKTRKAAEEAAERPDFLFQVDLLHLTGSDFGFVNKEGDPEYRIFLSDSDFHLTNFTNRRRKGPAEATLEGKFMGIGTSKAVMTFIPDTEGPNFDLMVEIQGTPLTRMNDLLRTHAEMDVVAGTFALYSEISVRDGQIDGYVKPFFRDVEIYDPEQDKDKGLWKKIREGLADVVGTILENPREEVATQFDLQGEVEDPDASTFQIIMQLIRNGFFDAILPGFERESGGERE